MEGVCDIGICRWARSEERSDAMRIVSDERRRPAANANVPEGCAGMGRCRVAPLPPMRKASLAPLAQAKLALSASGEAKLRREPPLLTAPHPRATQTRSIAQTGSWPDGTI
jgi:hypothetical protein